MTSLNSLHITPNQRSRPLLSPSTARQQHFLSQHIEATNTQQVHQADRFRQQQRQRALNQALLRGFQPRIGY